MMYLEKMSLAASASGRSILIFTSSRPGRRIAGSIMSSRLDAPITMTFSRPFDAVDLAEQLRDDRVLDVGGHARAAGAEDRVHLVEEHDDRRALARLLPGPLEHQPDVPLGLPDVLVQQLRALDVEEEALAFLGRRPSVRPAAADLRRPSWPASSRPPWRSASCRSRAGRRAARPSAAAAGARGTGRRAGTAARSRRGSARSAARGHRCRRSRCPGPLRGSVPRPRSWESARRRSRTAARAAASHRRAACRSQQRLGEPDDPLLVGVPDHQRPVAALEDLLEHHDFADPSR